MADNQRETWRFIWKQAIDAGQRSLLDMFKSVDDYFEELRKTFGDDKMITFEKAICLECKGEIEKAKILYEKSQSEKKQADGEYEGLPVDHWRKRARFFFDRITGIKTDKYTDLFEVQWTAYYSLHSYSYLHPYIRYIAISSISRIDNEAALCIMALKSCLNMAVSMYWTVDPENENNPDLPLSARIDAISKTDLIATKDVKEKMQLIATEGNIAENPFTKPENWQDDEREVHTHKPPFDYSDIKLITILEAFDIAMKACNENAKKYKGKLDKYLQINGKTC